MTCRQGQSGIFRDEGTIFRSSEGERDCEWEKGEEGKIEIHRKIDMERGEGKRKRRE